MDLDNIKKTWQQAEIKPTIDEGKIQKMLDNRGQSAFNSIIKYEKVGMIGLIICALVSYPIFHKHMPVFWGYLVTCFIGIAWQYHKFRSLKNANIAESGIVEVSKFYYKYRKKVINELIVCVIWLLLFCAFFLYFELRQIDDPQLFRSLLFVFIGSFGFFTIIGFFIYKKLFWNNLKRIEASLKEVEEFEEDNNLNN